MATYQNSVDGALRLVGRLASGESPTTQENTDYLQVVKEMLGTWTAKLGPIFAETNEALTWTGGQASRTIGVSGNLNTSRPLKILLAQYRDSSSFDYPPLNLITHQEYQTITGRKSLASPIPLYLAYNPTFTSSLGNLFVWPVPASSWTLSLTSLKPLSLPTALSDTITLPPGWEEALRYNLAIRFAPENGADLFPSVYEIARDSLWTITRANDVVQDMDLDPMAPGGCENEDDISLWTQP